MEYKNNFRNDEVNVKDLMTDKEIKVGDAKIKKAMIAKEKYDKYCEKMGFNDGIIWDENGNYMCRVPQKAADENWSCIKMADFILNLAQDEQYYE